MVDASGMFNARATAKNTRPYGTKYDNAGDDWVRRRHRNLDGPGDDGACRRRQSTVESGNRPRQAGLADARRPDRLSISISTHPAMPADIVNPAAPTAEQYRGAAGAEWQTHIRARSSIRRGPARIAKAFAYLASRNTSMRRATSPTLTPTARLPIPRESPRHTPRRCAEATGLEGDEAATTSPSARNARDEGTTKKAICRRPESRRLRIASAPVASSSMAPDIAGNSAAETETPKRLTGSVYRTWAFMRPVTAPCRQQAGEQCIDDARSPARRPD